MAKRTKKLIENRQIDDEIRVNKYLSDAGACSRREADKFIEAGKVTIDGVTAIMGSKVKAGQVVLLQGQPVDKDESLALIAFNKPKGIVCTTDKREKNNIIDYLQYNKRIYPIGRLDKESEGLILLTNDGDIVNKILRAGNNHEKEYIVTVNKVITSEFLKGMESGVPILDTVTRPCEIKALDKFSFQIILTQGLNRQIRRMCEYFDYKVLTLKRTRVMNINLGYLQVGGYRNITEREIAGLNELISNSTNTADTIGSSMEDASDDDTDKRKREYHPGSSHNSYKKPYKRNVTNKDIRKTDTLKKDAPGRDFSKKDTFRKDAPNGDTLRKNAPKRDKLIKDAPKRDTFRKDASARNIPRTDGLRRDTLRKDASNRDMPRRDAPKRDTLRNEEPKKDMLRKETPRKDAYKKDMFRKETSRKDTSKREGFRKDESGKDTFKREGFRKDESGKDTPNRESFRKNESRKDMSKRDGFRKNESGKGTPKREGFRKNESRKDMPKREGFRKDESRKDMPKSDKIIKEVSSTSPKKDTYIKGGNSSGKARSYHKMDDKSYKSRSSDNSNKTQKQFNKKPGGSASRGRR